jgi:parvulin-like peptidyl-prolyl isomerase
LPYGGLDWVAYDPAYQGSQSFQPTPVPEVVIPEIPCSELPELGEPLAAVVNSYPEGVGEPQGIRLAAYERELTQFLDALEASGVDLESEEVQAEMPTYRQEILEMLIGEVLVQQAAVEAGIVVIDEDIQLRVAEQVEQGGGVEPFEAWLQETGQTWEEFDRTMCLDLLHQAVLDHVTFEITGTMEMVWARQIVVASEPDAMTVMERLASGEPFEVVASEVSIDEYTKQQGGDLGWFPQGFDWLPPEVEEAAFAGEPGQVQGPIQVEEVFVILQTLCCQEDRLLEPEVRDVLRAVAFEKWLAERWEAAEIEIFVDLE